MATRSTLDELAVYDRALRPGKPGERPLTVAVGRMLEQDAAATGKFARALVSLLRPDLPVPPSRLLCEPEGPFYRGFRDRQADLLLRSTPGDYVLVVEGKLNAPTGRKQVADYMNARPKSFGARRGARIYVALIANKALVPRDKTNSKRWLGAVTWVEVLDELQRLEFTDYERGERWRRLLGHYRDAGGFGAAGSVIDDPVQTLNALVFRSVRDIDQALRGHGGSAYASRWSPSGEAVVRKTKRGAAMRLMIRARRQRRARLIEVRLDRPRAAGLGTRIVIYDGRGPHSRERFSAEAGANVELIRDQLRRELGDPTK